MTADNRIRNGLTWQLKLRHDPFRLKKQEYLAIDYKLNAVAFPHQSIAIKQGWGMR